MLKIIGTIVEAVVPTLELDEEPFCDKMQELLKAGKLITACEAFAKNGFMGA